MPDLDPVVLIGCGAGAAAAAPTPESVGFKAYNLYRMDRVGMPVPPAFVLGTRLCQDYFRHNRKPVRGLPELLAGRMRDLERAAGLGFGSTRRPLLVSVRSGAAVSMPGMLDTVLGIGLCDAVVPGLLRLTGNPRLVWDSYRRLVQCFGETVHGVPADRFDAALAARLRQAGVADARELDFRDLRALTHDFLEIHEQEAGVPFPQQPAEQLEAAVIAVWNSWAADRAVRYRRLHGLPDERGTGVTVQRMVYGNAGATSGAGVAFTRDPASGENALYLDFTFNAQGHDIVSGRQTLSGGGRLQSALPALHEEIRQTARRLEAEFRDMQEFEFTVQDGRLYLLQTRAGQRTPWAALRIAVDQVDEGLITEATALERLAHCELGRVARSRTVAADGRAPACRGIPAGIGVAVGEIALDVPRARAVAAAGRRALLVRESPSTDDLAGIEAAVGVLTVTGSRTSHAAVVARQLDRPCVVGCAALAIDLARRRCTVAGQSLAEGSVLSVDGGTGDVFIGPVTVEVEQPAASLARVEAWRAAQPRSRREPAAAAPDATSAARA